MIGLIPDPSKRMVSALLTTLESPATRTKNLWLIYSLNESNNTKKLFWPLLQGNSVVINNLVNYFIC
jgi:hypothetical protein